MKPFTKLISAVAAREVRFGGTPARQGGLEDTRDIRSPAASVAHVPAATPLPQSLAAFGRWILVTILVCTALVAVGLFAAGPVRAASGGGSWDVSFPQCAGTGTVGLPVTPAMGIVGVNNGTPFTTNPCLPAQVTWAGTALAAYINTDDPGPASRLWPAVTTAKSHTGPRRCVAVRRSRSTITCAFDYGWKAGRDAFTRMRRALARVAAEPGMSSRVPASAASMRWWLDVESANWWSRSTAMNTASIAGTLAYLRAVHVQSVGIYANRSDSHSLFTTNSTSFAAGTLSWLATGATTLTGGLGLCDYRGFTGAGYTWMIQYWPSSLDADAQCAGYIGGLGVVSAGMPATGLRVTLVQPAPVATTVTLTTSSPGGAFAATSAGPWTPALAIPIGAGARQGSTFAYRDTRAGVPSISASASGIPGRIGRYGLIVAGAPASITTTRPTFSVPVGANVRIGITGADAYGNAVTTGLAASWSTTPAILGAVGHSAGPSTVFQANAVGIATVQARLGALSTTAIVKVIAPPGGAPGTLAGGVRLTAGVRSGPMRIRSWSPASPATSAWTLAVSAPAARVAAAPTGPWVRTLQVTVPVGQIYSAQFYVRDTSAGAVTVTATGGGGTINSALMVVHGRAAAITATPAVVRIPVGGSSVIRVTGRDGFGNPIAVSGRWSVARPGVARLSVSRGMAARAHGRARGTTWVIVHVGALTTAVRVVVG